MTVSGRDNYLITLSVIVCLVPILLIRRSRRGALPLPPGPKRWPVIGSALSVPKEREWLTFTDWSRQYGESQELLSYGAPLTVAQSLI